MVFDRPRGSSKVIIISPLKTLMEDQVQFLKALGLSAVALHDEQSEEILKDVKRGSFTYLFTSPERNHEFMQHKLLWHFGVIANQSCQASNQSAVHGSLRNSRICEHDSKQRFADALFPQGARKLDTSARRLRS